MIVWHKHARRAAQWVVDAVMGNGLAQQENDDAEQGHISPDLPAVARRAAAEGCVLLENDGTLPLHPEAEVAVFGRCALDWFFMGNGSGGNVHPPYAVNLMEGLANAGVRYNRVLAEVYRAWCTNEEHAADQGWWGHWPTYHPEMPVDAELAQAAASTADVAVVVFGRNAGEDRDVPLAPGGFYLADGERELLEVVCAAFEHTVVVLNTSNVIDLSWVSEYGARIGAVLLAWQGGMEAGNAVADVLYGRVNPSGRLSCTVARSYADYPSSGTFGNKRQVDYTEGVFVGYRHFATSAPDAVLYPFGHGLSYTTFETTITSVERADDTVLVRARVTNTGACAGLHAVLVWCEPPYGELAKPARILSAFGKTGELEPGASTELEFACGLKTLASFDEGTHEFVIEPGTYIFAADEARGCASFDERLVVERCTPLCQTSDELHKRILENLPAETAPTGERSIAFSNVAEGSVTLDEFIAQLSDEELEALTCGEGAMNSTLGTPGNAGAFGGVTKSLRERGVPALICADGPSGGRLQRRCSLLPSATTLACTWNAQLVEELYGLVGDELRANGVDVLLAPGMNIQRDPRCGRNFEYFSEDPLASGHMAAAVVRGLQGAGVSACPKHFACNNQETRRNTSDSCVSERALREVYLRGFEICVREAAPDLLMMSYNKINGVWAHYHYDLATTVLREDWGFAGVVITDWWMRPARSPEFGELRDNAYRIRAGVDVLMPGSMSHVLPVHARPHGITRAELQRTARRVLGYALNKSVNRG